MNTATDQARKAIELGYKPVPINNGKWVRKGDSVTVTYAPSDWRDDETTAIRTGRQDDKLFLARLDLDKHTDDQDPIARLADIRQIAGEDIYSRLVIVRSTGGLGRDILFKTPVTLRSGTALRDWNRIEAGEILCEGKNARANIPADSRRWIQGSLETIPTLTRAETDRLLSAFILPEEKPKQATTRTIKTGPSGALAEGKANTDLIDLLVSYGARIARPSQLHCHCPYHSHKDANPSLSVTTNRNGDQVVIGHGSGCIYNKGHSNDAVNVIQINENLTFAQIAVKYGPPLELNTVSEVATTAQEAPRQAVATEPTKDTQRKRKERQRQRDTRRDAIRLAIETKQGLSKRARELALSLLAEDSLQSRTTNKQLATRLGWGESTVIRAFRDLKAAELGKRTGGVSHVANKDGQWIAAVWNWFNDNAALSDTPQSDTPKSVHAALSDTPIVCTNFEADPGGACEEKMSFSGELATDDSPAIGRAGLAVILRTYLNDIQIGKRASLKQATIFVESYLPGAFNEDVVKDVYSRLMEQRRWDLATRDIPTMAWKDLKREGARARGMAVKLSKAGENPAFFSALADQFDREVQARVNRGDAPTHYRRRKVGTAPVSTQFAMELESIGEQPRLDISSSQAPLSAAALEKVVQIEIKPIDTIRAIPVTYRRNLSVPPRVRIEEAELAHIAAYDMGVYEYAQ
jgi:hypothetical protein